MENKLKLAIAAFVLALAFGAGLNMSGLVNVPIASVLFGVAGCSLVYIVWQFLRNLRADAAREVASAHRVLTWPGISLCGRRLAIEHMSATLVAALAAAGIILFVVTSRPEPWRGWLQAANEPTPQTGCDNYPIPAGSDFTIMVLGHGGVRLSKVGKTRAISIGGCDNLVLERSSDGLKVNAVFFDKTGNKLGELFDNGYEIEKNGLTVEHSGDLSTLVVHDRSKKYCM
jgi:hypothetical protein